ncbi:unnamed protein product [marine sediment metagenome]|uniref:Uncharacterized protein n=1 Tax=marine sediment metagenome TaxID=412755 RepID=X1HSY0_9ZZZZ
MSQVNLFCSNEWKAEPGQELRIPSVYITQLKYEIVVLAQKKEFTFRCSKYKKVRGGAWRFDNVIIDSSKLNAQGDVELKRVTYHPEIHLVAVPFMIIPAPE